MARDRVVTEVVPPRDPEVRQLLVQSVRLIERAEVLYNQLTAHQAEMAAFLTRAQQFVELEEKHSE